MPLHPIQFEAEAEKQYKGYYPHFQREIAVHLSLLQNDPTTLSRPSPTPPYPPGYLIYQFETVFGGAAFSMTIFFEIEDGGTILVSFFGLHQQQEQ